MARTISKLLQGAQILLPLICFALAASMLGLGSDVLAFTHSHRDDKVWLRDNTGFFAWLLHLPYLPNNFSLTRVVLLLVTSILCSILNAAVSVLLFKKRKVGVGADGRKSPTFRASLLVIVLDAIALLFTLAITIYAWHNLHPFPADGTKPINGVLDTYNEGSDVRWDPKTAFDPINWNCIVGAFAHRDFGTEIERLCYEGLALVDLTAPLLIFECMTLCVHFWFRRPNKNREVTDMDGAKTRGDSYRMDEFARSNANAAG